MSYYKHMKVLRYPLSKEDLNFLECHDRHDLEEIEEFKHLFDKTKRSHYFECSPTTRQFLDYVLFNSEDYNDHFGKVRELYNSEKIKAKALYSQILTNIDENKIKYVEYCWYNCSEADDWYDNTTDPFYDELKF